MMGTQEDSVKVFANMLIKMNRDMNILSDATSDRSAKRKALERIQTEISNPASQSYTLIAVILKQLLKSLVDPIEKCRELSITIIQTLIDTNTAESVTRQLPLIMPVFVVVLGSVEVVEQSEEIRWLFAKCLNSIITKTAAEFAPFVDDTCKILVRLVGDTYPEVRKEACGIILSVCESNAQALSYQGAKITKCLVTSLLHRHANVRVLAVQATCAAMIVDATGLDESLVALRELVFDKSPSVRESLYVLAGKWLVKLIDRYTFGDKVLPLLLAGESDELPKLRTLCRELIDQSGALYEQEWESRIKDEIDYSDGWNCLPGIF